MGFPKGMIVLSCPVLSYPILSAFGVGKVKEDLLCAGLGIFWKGDYKYYIFEDIEKLGGGDGKIGD